MNAVRPPAVAGSFYPGDPRVLQSELGELLDAVESLTPGIGYPKAIVVPHAGYIYSGPVAAHAYDALAPGRDLVRRVVLLGPVHRVPVRGLALPGCDVFLTPLGRIPVDADAVASLDGLPQVVTSAPAHAQEHALEVQLPFLQRALGHFSIVPIAVGEATVAQVAEVIERLWGGTETVIVISTDLSHYHAYDEARRMDGETLARIEALDASIDHHHACGATPLNGMLHLARDRGLRVRRLAACNSGDTAGGRGQVVGYAAFAIEEPTSVSLDSAGPALVALARDAIESRLRGEAPRDAAAGPAWLRQRGASFVTLTRGGTLRGCIGSLNASRALGEDVVANAQAAAFADPRFAALTAAEWPEVAVEVSLLSTPKPVAFADEAELLAALRPGEDGVIIEADGKRATFLPQVWDTLPEPRRFLGELLRKAGLPADQRLARCRVWRYRVHKWSAPRPSAH